MASRPFNLPLPTLPGRGGWAGAVPQGSASISGLTGSYLSARCLHQNQVKLGPAEGVMGLARVGGVWGAGRLPPSP